MINCCYKLQVTFNKKNFLYLIPSCSELTEIKDELWWSNKDLLLFLDDAMKEINYFKKENPLVTKKDIIKLLYQPNII